MDADPAKRPAELNDGQPEKPDELLPAVPSKTRKTVAERLKPHRGWRG